MRYPRHLAALAVLSLTAACGDTALAPRPDEPALRAATPEGYPTLGEVRSGFIRGTNGVPHEIRFQVHNGRAIWEGDIDLGPAESIARTARELSRPDSGARLGATRDGSSARWAGGVVPFVIASNLPSPTRVTDAIAHIELNTGRVDFVPRTTQTDYVYIRTSTGCSSSIGRVGGVQYVNLASGCSTGNTVHELLHALGQFHEQTRCDRETYVEILWGNITAGYEGNFNQQCTGATDYSDYAEGSIMHYSATSFSKNGLPTIRSRRGLDSQMGQRSGMNTTDVATINTIYP